VLRACRRLLRPGRRLAFFTIFVAPDLPAAPRRRAVATGPPFPHGSDLSGLLSRAGFAGVAASDLTSEYLDTTRAWQAAHERYADELRQASPTDFDDRIAEGRRAITAIEQGLLRRTLFVATRP